MGSAPRTRIWNCLSTPWWAQHLRTFPINAAECPVKMPPYENTTPNLSKSSKNDLELYLRLLSKAVRCPREDIQDLQQTHLHNLLSFPVGGGVAGSQA